MASCEEIVALIDLTSLNTNDDETVAVTVANRALSNPVGKTAAVCIYSNILSYAAPILRNPHSTVKVATVVNFPKGEGSLEEVANEVSRALEFADEVDIVFPYKSFPSNTDFASEIVKRTAETVHKKGAQLKVIIESGELVKTAGPVGLRDATLVCARAGADFVKTSTGKTPHGASVDDAREILIALRDYKAETGCVVGFKVSGGVRTKKQAEEYIAVAKEIMGEGYVNPRTFRIGASGLLDDLVQALQPSTDAEAMIPASTY